MKKKYASSTSNSTFLPIWGISLILLVVLYLMYSPSFTSDYLMNDELYFIGQNPRPEVVNHFFKYGRSLFGIYQSLIYNFIGYSPIKIQFVRFINFISLAAIALVLFRFLYLESKAIYLSFFAVLFFCSQPAFQGIIGYSVQVFANSQPSMWLSLGAFYLHFYLIPKFQLPKWLAYSIVFIIFMAAMQSTQTYAYFAMIPLSFLVLIEGNQRQRQISIFFVLALSSFITSVLLYKVGLEIFPNKAYGLGQSSMTALTSSPLEVLINAINPQKYWSAFKVWTYPYPFHYTLPLKENFKIIIAMLVMFVWSSLIIAAFITEFKHSKSKKLVFWKWLFALGCLSFGAFFIVADSPLQIIDHRPHMTITFVGVCIFIGVDALQVLDSTYGIFNSVIAKSIGILLVVITAFGAQSNVQRGIVNIKQDQINFIRTELFNKSPSEYQKIIVILSPENICVTEPCDPWFGEVTHQKWHATRKSGYRYALATLGISPTSKEITFVKSYPQQIAQNELVIDWRKYVTARKKYRNYLNRSIDLK